MTDKGPLVSSAEVGRRLAALRVSLDLNQSDVARRLKTSANKISQWEAGKFLPSLPAAISLCAEFGITLDWLYRGDRSGLPARIIAALDKGEPKNPNGRPSARAASATTSSRSRAG
jgi:transcriptional regulator with XRE-family HTH domain